MEEIKIFNSKEFGEIRTICIDGEPWFVGKDVCKAFGDTNYRRSLANIDDSDKCVSKIDTAGGKQNMVIINESGLYSLLFQMQPQKAKGVSQNDFLIEERIQKLKRFKKWVTSEVLPSIRKKGYYGAPKTTAEQIQLLAQGNIELNQKIEKVESDLQEFKEDMPLLTIECDTISRAARRKGVDVMGGKQTEAYRDKSLRSKVYGDIYRELKRQFNVNSYKAIRRRDCKKAVGVIEAYRLPVFLEEQVNDSNAQMRLNNR